MINPETMVTMKTKHFLGIVASAWMLAACSNQDELLQQDELVAKQCVTVNAYVPDGADSRLAFEDQGANGLKVSWNESGESFAFNIFSDDNELSAHFKHLLEKGEYLLNV